MTPARGAGDRQGRGELSPARLAHQPAALLGRAHPHHLLRCVVVPVPYEDLPVLLPDDAERMPTGESPLKYHQGPAHHLPAVWWPGAARDGHDGHLHVLLVVPLCHVSHYEGDVPLTREGRYWLPVDQYTGGIEHATMHPCTRFFTKAMLTWGW